MDVTPLRYLIWTINVALGIGFLTLLLREGYGRKFPALAFYVGVQAVQSAVTLGLVLLETSRFVYGIAFMTGQVLLIVASLLLVHAVWQRGLAEYRGFHRLCPVLLVITLLGLLLVVQRTSGYGQGFPPTVEQWIYGWFQLVVRSLSFTVAVFVAVFFGVVYRFDLRIERRLRQVALATLCFAMWRCLVFSWSYFQGPAAQQVYNYGFMLSSTFLLAAWTMTFVGQEMDRPVELLAPFAFKGDPEVLQQRMATMNRALISLLG